MITTASQTLTLLIYIFNNGATVTQAESKVRQHTTMKRYNLITR